MVSARNHYAEIRVGLCCLEGFHSAHPGSLILRAIFALHGESETSFALRLRQVNAEIDDVSSGYCVYGEACFVLSLAHVSSSEISRFSVPRGEGGEEMQTNALSSSFTSVSFRTVAHNTFNSPFAMILLVDFDSELRRQNTAPEKLIYHWQGREYQQCQPHQRVESREL
jgi:hypothetical protein